MLVIFSASLLIVIAICAQETPAKREPLTFLLDCANGDCRLLKGVPKTSGMRGGSVKLRPGKRGLAFHGRKRRSCGDSSWDGSGKD